MRHLDDKTVLKLAMNEATEEEHGFARLHLEACGPCRARLEDTRRAWSRLDADPAAALPDTPLWPAVARALEAGDRSRGVAPALRPAWKLALAEARHAPLAYAALVVLALGIGGGHLTGRALLGDDAVAVTAADEELLDYTALAGLPDGSLAAGYLGEDLYVSEAGSGEETER